MRKIIAVLLLCAFVFSCQFFNATVVEASDNIVKDGFHYRIENDGSATIIAYIGKSDDVIIPNLLDGHPVMSVIANPFVYYPSDYWDYVRSYASYDLLDIISRNCNVSVADDHPYLATINGVLFGKTDKKLIYYPPQKTESIYQIPDGISIIGAAAFAENSVLNTVKIPNSVYKIESSAFRNSSITSITIPNTVQSMNGGGSNNYNRSGSFRDCKKLNNVILENGLYTIGKSAFHGCDSLSKITIPNSVVIIEQDAFLQSGLTEVSIPSSVRQIGYHAFSGTKLEEITIPNTVTEFESIAAFRGCNNLKRITLPKGVTIIEAEMFYGCSSLKEFIIPDTVKSIEREAFENCKSLTSIVIPNSVKTIGWYAFSGCESLLSVTIPKSVTKIEQGAFSRGKLIIIAEEGSQAEFYCSMEGITCMHPGTGLNDAPLGWLNNN